jgi:hypothetical protein
MLDDLIFNRAVNPSCCSSTNPDDMCDNCKRLARNGDFTETDGFGEPENFAHGLDDDDMLLPPQHLEAIADQRSKYHDDDNDGATTGDNRYRGDRYIGSGRNKGGQNWGGASSPTTDRSDFDPVDPNEPARGIPAFDRANNQLQLTYNGASEPNPDLLIPPTMNFAARKQYELPTPRML